MKATVGVILHQQPTSVVSPVCFSFVIVVFFFLQRQHPRGAEVSAAGGVGGAAAGPGRLSFPFFFDPDFDSALENLGAPRR